MPRYNGVGAYWMPDRMRDLVTAWFLLDFSEDLAEQHDLDYWLKIEPRKDIDKTFLLRMRGQAKSIRAHIKAYFIYLIVRAFGSKSYNKRKYYDE